MARARPQPSDAAPAAAKTLEESGTLRRVDARRNAPVQDRPRAARGTAPFLNENWLMSLARLARHVGSSSAVSAAPASRGPTRSTTRWRSFSTTSSRSTEQGVGELAASGAPNAAAIIEALGDNRLLIDAAQHRLVYRTQTGEMIDAKSGQTLAGADARSSRRCASTTRCAARSRRRSAPSRSPIRTRQTRRGRGGGLQVARRQSAARARGAARQGKRPARRRGAAPSARGHPRARCAARPQPIARRHCGAERPRRSGRAGPAR